MAASGKVSFTAVATAPAILGHLQYNSRLVIHEIQRATVKRLMRKKKCIK